MSQSPTYSRRQVLTGSVTAGLGLVVIGAAACKDPAPLACTDVSALSEDDRNARNLLKYVDNSVDAAKFCGNCAQFKAPAQANTCGACLVVKGPINPKGYCNVWAAKPA